MDYPFFYEPYADFDEIVLSDETMHHALSVLRMKEGDQFWLTNGQGKNVLCEIDAVKKKFCHIRQGEKITQEPNAFGLHLGIALTKNAARNEWLMEKVTEMGIQQITPLICHRSEKLHMRRDRLEKILISAMLQSKQVFLPQLNEATQFNHIIQGPEDIKCMAYCGDEVEKKQLIDYLKPAQHTLILIGPEGDFTPEEVQQGITNHFTAVSLGVNRLRTETAGLFACAIYNAINH